MKRFRRSKINPSPQKPLTKFSAIDGLMITDGENYWFIKNGRRMKCYSQRSFESWGIPAILVTSNAARSLKLSGTLGFRDGSLIKDVGNGKIYLVSGGKTRHITSPDLLKIYGAKIVEVSSAEINIHTTGEEISDIL